MDDISDARKFVRNRSFPPFESAFFPNIDVNGGYWRLLFSGPALNIASECHFSKFRVVWKQY